MILAKAIMQGPTDLWFCQNPPCMFIVDSQCNVCDSSKLRRGDYEEVSEVTLAEVMAYHFVSYCRIALVSSLCQAVTE